MDSSRSLSDTLLQSSESTGSIGSSFGSSSSSSGSMFDSIKNINWTTWLLIILILAFLGFNVFAYLAKGTQDITSVFSPILGKLFGTTVAVTGQAVDVAAEGAKVVVADTANVVETGLTAVQDITPNGSQGSNIQKPGQQAPPQNGLTRALQQSRPPQEQDYQAHEASSSYDGTGGKSGWCYIGEDRGYRTCAQVGVNDTCMSGDIFPSQEICMNPNLRA